MSLRYVDHLLQIGALFFTSCLCDAPALVYQVSFDLPHAGTEVDSADLLMELVQISIGIVQNPISSTF